MADTAESGNKMASEGTKKDDPDLESTMEPLVLCKENEGGVHVEENALTKVCRLLKSKEFWKARFPCSYWIPEYRFSTFIGDTIAGTTTALTVIPQGIGYAPLAGLPLQYGLYASILPGFIYAVFGTTKELSVGPTAVNAIMSFNYAGSDAGKAATLALFTGIIEFIMGFLNLGFLLHFVSDPVITAFSSAVAIQVITSQIKGLFGIKYPARGFLNVWIGLFQNIKKTSLPDLGSGVVSILILFMIRKLKECKVCEGPDPNAMRAKVIKKIKWFLSISANCIIIIIEWVGVEETSIKEILDSRDPIQILQDLGTGLVMLPLVSLLQHLAIAKHYAGSKKMKASQEMSALGLIQIAGSFVGSMCVTASFGRSAVNASSGVKTPFGGVITGLIIILACAVLSTYLKYIPTSILSAVIIFSMFSTIDVNLLITLIKTKSIDLLPCLVTFLLGLFYSVESGLIIGTLIHSLLVVYLSTRLKVCVKDEDKFTIIQPDRELFYPSVDSLRSTLNEAAKRKMPILVDLSRSTYLDYSSSTTLIASIKSIEKSGTKVLLVLAEDQAQALGGPLTGLNFYYSVEDATLEIIA
ncbi:sodium-independent sulfate anion transporter [Eurytemora carolleeae]|uniref:sodium-independent sulfate anion transporter n=1 Tax=Eurytemora carolleeae TaxID=1294199 RepID=UPI000C7917AD|nr:sodium-independent sulfate anion transporter [Eurytemora carolleeae]|eukprot:XP_023324357.1 sodium-independent sulfate anion transporter-like [Eurytemora affinis]